MDINYHNKTHHKIIENFRHDIIMRKLKQKEDKEFRNMFIKTVLVLVIFVLLVYIIIK